MRLLVTTLCFAAGSACLCQPQPLNVGSHDAGGPRPVHQVSGTYCTSRADRNGFPTRVFLLVENGAAQCAIDAEAGPDGGCPELTIARAAVAARTRVLERLVAEAPSFATFQLVTFSSQQTAWPATGPAHPEPVMHQLLAGLGRTAGGLSDYEGALRFVDTQIRADIERTAITIPALLPRMRYVVVLVGSGLPQLRCAPPGAVVSDTPGNLETWPTSSQAECDRLGTPSRNQPAGLTSIVGGLRAFAERRNTSVTINTVQLFDEPALMSCGAACAGLEPWQRAPGARGWTAREQVETGHALLSRLATIGGGVTVQATSPSTLQTVTVPTSVLETAASENVLKALVLVPMSVRSGAQAPRLDTDGDGLADDDEPGFELERDRDQDCFADGVEQRLAASHGFDPAVADVRGCDPRNPLTPGCRCSDTDGDRASAWEEGYFTPLGRTLVDGDADGLPDGIELAAGLSPDTPLPEGRDTDADGAPDRDEVLAMTDPLVADRAYAAQHAITRTVSQRLEPRPDGSTCYDFTFTNVPLVDLPASLGLNRFLLYAAEAPRAVVPRDYGGWRAACLFISWPGEGVSQTHTIRSTDLGPPPNAATECSKVSP